MSLRDPRASGARAQVALYSFAFEDDAGELTRYLLPLLDLVNHRGGANAYVERHAPSRTFRLLALVDIRCGKPRRGGALMLPWGEGRTRVWVGAYAPAADAPTWPVGQGCARALGRSRAKWTCVCHYGNCF